MVYVGDNTKITDVFLHRHCAILAEKVLYRKIANGVELFGVALRFGGR